MAIVFDFLEGTEIGLCSALEPILGGHLEIGSKMHQQVKDLHQSVQTDEITQAPRRLWTNVKVSKMSSNLHPKILPLPKGNKIQRFLSWLKRFSVTAKWDNSTFKSLFFTHPPNPLFITLLPLLPSSTLRKFQRDNLAKPPGSSLALWQDRALSRPHGNLQSRKREEALESGTDVPDLERLGKSLDYPRTEYSIQLHESAPLLPVPIPTLRRKVPDLSHE